MKQTAREKILVAAEAEMLAKGYSATTVDEICDRAGVSKGSFYHFFGSKEDLGLAVLDAYFDRNRRILEQAPDLPADPRERAAAVANHLVASAGTMWGGGCLLGTFALELAETSPRIAAAVSEKFRELGAMLAQVFAPLTSRGNEDDAMPLAEAFIVTVEGALILARAHGDWSYVERALRRFQVSAGLSTAA